MVCVSAVGVWYLLTQTPQAQRNSLKRELTEYRSASQRKAALKAYRVAADAGWLENAPDVRQQYKQLGDRQDRAVRLFHDVYSAVTQEAHRRLRAKGIQIPLDQPFGDDFKRELEPVWVIHEMITVDGQLNLMDLRIHWANRSEEHDKAYTPEKLEEDRKRFTELKSLMNALLAD